MRYINLFRILFLLASFFVVPITSSAQDLKVHTYDNSQGTILYRHIASFGNNGYLISTLTRFDHSDSAQYSQIIHIQSDLEIAKEFLYRDKLITQIITRNDSIFVFGKTNRNHNEGPNKHKVWLLDSLFNLSVFKEWELVNALDSLDLKRSITEKNNKYYGVLSRSGIQASAVVVLNKDFSLAEDFYPSNSGYFLNIAVGDSTFALQGNNMNLFDKNWNFIKSTVSPEQTNPVPQQRNGYRYRAFTGLHFEKGRYIVTGSASIDSVSLATGRPEFFINDEIYTLSTNENGADTKVSVFGENIWHESTHFSQNALIPINEGRFLICGNIEPIPENLGGVGGQHPQILAMRSNRDFTQVSKSNAFGETDKAYNFIHSTFNNIENEAVVIGTFADCNGFGQACRSYGNYILRLKDEFLTTSVEDFNHVLKNLSIYPNPAQSNGSVKLSWSGIESQNWALQLFNNQGQMVYNTNITQAQKEVQIQLPQLPKGNYILRATGNNKQVHTGNLLLE